jgi:hypothetical protein
MVASFTPLPPSFNPLHPVGARKTADAFVDTSFFFTKMKKGRFLSIQTSP